MTNQISRDELRGAIADKLSAHFGVTAENATDEQVFQEIGRASCRERV